MSKDGKPPRARRRKAARKPATTDQAEARIAAEVHKRLAAILREHQAQSAATMAAALKQALSGVEQTNATLRKQQAAVVKQQGAAQRLRDKAEREGEAMAIAAFHAHQRQQVEAAQTALLREQILRHLAIGNPDADIVYWLGAPLRLVQRIRQLETAAGRLPTESRRSSPPLPGAVVHFMDNGRSGTIRFESPAATFELWWEMGIKALTLVDAPSPEQWTSRTGLPRECREAVLEFIGAEVVAHQAHRGYFIVGENVISIFAPGTAP